MGTISVFEAIDRATDPFGPDGTRIAAARPSAKEVLIRLGNLGFSIVPLPMVKYTFTEIPLLTPQEARVLEGIEQYQVESR